jgi:hypothetical protein
MGAPKAGSAFLLQHELEVKERHELWNAFSAT